VISFDWLSNWSADSLAAKWSGIANLNHESWERGLIRKWIMWLVRRMKTLYDMFSAIWQVHFRRA
jgi:hypothetical protein